jgi:hypothetical protein
MRIVAAFVQNERSAAAALFGIEPQSFNHLANRGGVECRHAAWNAREPGGSVGGAQSGNPRRSGHYLTVRK